MYLLKKILCTLIFAAVFCTPVSAYADNSIIDALNLAPFVPLVLDALMTVATGGYEYFVGHDGHGIIYVFIWIFLGTTILLSLVKMYWPQQWLGFVGLSGGGEIAAGKTNGYKVIENTAKPAFRALIAAIFLLQVQPTFLTQWLVNPFLQLGAVYTHHITDQINESGVSAPAVACPYDVVDNAWLTPESCEFLVQPVADLSHANNQIVKRGFEFITRGLRGLITLVPHGGADFMNLITGILLVFTFVSSNLFMALLIIQGIFNFGMQLILYPFYVLTYVMKSSDKWFDIWPVFSGITKALQQLIITMIACGFILCINLAIIKALFQWDTSIFVVAAGGTATSNVPTAANSAMGFGEHSLTWMSAILTFYLMFRIFSMTQEQLQKYIGGGMDGLYKQVKSDAGTMTSNLKNWGQKIGTAIGWLKKK